MDSRSDVTVPAKPSAHRPSGPQAAPRTSALLVVLDEGKDVLERTAGRVGQGVSLLGLVVSAYVAVAVSGALGGVMLVIASGALAWFSVVVTLTRKPHLARRLAWVTPLVEVSLPSIVLVALGVVQGPAYAVASWVPPQLYTVIILLSLLRLRSPLPAILGTVAALQYIAVVAWFLRDVGPAGPESNLRWDLQVVRAVTLVLAGGLASAVVLAVRRGLDRVAGRARSKDLFGKYRIERTIASGGMGTVVKAIYCPEGGFERPVAIKRVHSHLAADKRFVKGFRAEAELCARLGHPNIVSVLDFGSVDDTYFFAMEYIGGLNLAQLIERVQHKRSSIDPAVAAFVAEQVAKGLHFAHAVATDGEGKRLRVVHRDLSPTNVLVSWGGEVKVSDFGIARVLRDATGHQTDHLTGKVAYMAPEQAVGESFDERADLFSLGLVLRELLTLTTQFKRPTQAATLLAVLKDTVPPVQQDRPDVPDALAAIIDRLLERDPAVRYPSALAVADALGAFLDEVGRPGAESLRALMLSVRDEEDPATEQVRVPSSSGVRVPDLETTAVERPS
jgi:serine/threonine protein kinase